jgi:hypothetical protein
MYLFCNKYGKGIRIHINVCSVKLKGQPCPHLNSLPMLKIYECTFVSKSEKIIINKKLERKKNVKKQLK